MQFNFLLYLITKRDVNGYKMLFWVMHSTVQSIDRIFCYTIRRKLCSSRKSDSWSSSCCWWCKAMERNSSNWGMLRNCTLTFETLWTWTHHIRHNTSANKWVRIVASLLMVVLHSLWQCGHGWSVTGYKPIRDWSCKIGFITGIPQLIIAQDSLGVWGTWLWSYINWWLLCHHHRRPARRPTRRLPAHILISHIRSRNHRVNFSVSWRVRNLFIVRI